MCVYTLHNSSKADVGVIFHDGQISHNTHDFTKLIHSVNEDLNLAVDTYATADKKHSF